MTNIHRGAAGLAAACLLSACAQRGPEMRPGTAPIIRVGQTVQGTLGAGDPTAWERGAFRAYRFEGVAGQRLVATMEAADFDAYLLLGRLHGPVMEEIKSDDDGGEETNARMRFTVPANGSYVLVAQSYAEEGAGPYTLALGQQGEASTGGTRPLPLGETVTGELAETDMIDDEEDRTYDAWTFTGRAGQRIAVQMDSEAFDAVVQLGRLRDGAWEMIDSDDDGGAEGTNALLRETLEEDGEYVIRATAFGDGMGAYTLRMEERREVAAVPQPLQAGVPASGTLDTSDPVLEEDESFYDLWTYRGRAGEQLRITMESDEFDTYLSIGRMRGGEYEEIANMDDGEEGTNSLLEVTLPADGEYVIRANSFNAEETGSYTLRLTVTGTADFSGTSRPEL